MHGVEDHKLDVWDKDQEEHMDNKPYYVELLIYGADKATFAQFTAFHRRMALKFRCPEGKIFFSVLPEGPDV